MTKEEGDILRLAEAILDKHYQPRMHWKVVNRKNVLNAMKEFSEELEAHANSKIPSEKEVADKAYTEYPEEGGYHGMAREAFFRCYNWLKSLAKTTNNN